MRRTIGVIAITAIQLGVSCQSPKYVPNVPPPIPPYSKTLLSKNNKLAWDVYNHIKKQFKNCSDITVIRLVSYGCQGPYFDDNGRLIKEFHEKWYIKWSEKKMIFIVTIIVDPKTEYKIRSGFYPYDFDD
jgi:hypothetical protein